MELTAAQVKMYNTAAHVWNEVRKSLEHAVARCNCSNNRVWATFWAAHQRFFKQLWFVSSSQHFEALHIFTAL